MKTLNAFDHYSRNEQSYFDKFGSINHKLINPEYELELWADDLRTDLTPTQLEIALTWKAQQIHDKYKQELIKRKPAYLRAVAKTKQLKNPQEVRENYCLTVGWEFEAYILNRFRNNYDIHK